MLILQALLVPLIVLILLGLVIVIGCDGLSSRVYDTPREPLPAWVDKIGPTVSAGNTLIETSFQFKELAEPDTLTASAHLSRLAIADLEFSTIENLNGE